MATKVTNGLDLQNQRVANVGDPTAAQDAATKNYVDASARGLDWKASVRAASTGNLTISGPGTTVDGVTLALNDRFLAKDQTTGSQNGIYVWNGAAVPATRSIDADSNAEVTSGMAATVTEGTVNAGRVYNLTTADPIVLGTTSLAFSILGGAVAPYVGGNGLVLSGMTFNVGAGVGIVVNADDVAIDTNVVMRRFAQAIGDGTATSITVTHNFGTRDVHVAVYLNSGAFGDEIADVERSSVNAVVIKFATAPAAGAYRVVVVG